jgi:hypothetical protein
MGLFGRIENTGLNPFAGGKYAEPKRQAECWSEYALFNLGQSLP